MRQVKHIALPMAALITIVLALSACRADEPLHGSCVLIAARDKSRTCMDFYLGKTTEGWQKTCRSINGAWSDEACDTTGALGGCRSGEDGSILWIYESGSFKSIEDARTACDNRPGSAFILPPGK